MDFRDTQIFIPCHLSHLHVAGGEIIKNTEAGDSSVGLFRRRIVEGFTENDAKLEFDIEIFAVAGICDRCIVRVESQVVRLIEDGLLVPEGVGFEERKVSTGDLGEQSA